MDVTFKLSQLSIIAKAITIVGTTKEASVLFYEHKYKLCVSMDNEVSISCNTNIDIAKNISLAVNAVEFVNYIQYLDGFKLGGDVILDFLQDSLLIKYSEGGVKNYVYIEYLTNTQPLMQNVVADSTFVIDKDVLINDFSKALIGTSKTLFSNAYNGLILFKNKDIYIGGTDSVKCVIVKVDIDLPDDYDCIFFTTECVSAITGISKLTGLPCEIGIIDGKFKAVIGAFNILGPIYTKGPPIQQLLEIEGVKFNIDTKLFVNALRGAMHASKRDIYKAINLRFELSNVRVKCANFEVAIECMGDKEGTIETSFNSNNLYTLCSLFNTDTLRFYLNKDIPTVIFDNNIRAYISPVEA